ncbi:MAG: IS4 family transposase [Prevotella copri]|nr:IS4 family transposase [Segatella copri]
MNQGRYVFTQLVDFLPRKNFEWLVKKYEGNKYVKSFTCWNHLMVLLFGQLSNREGLRDLIVSITPFKSAFHHLGFGKNVSRSNLSKANEIREVKIFQEFADKMVSIARETCGVVKDFFISNNVYAFDSSTISLCLSVYWWTKLHHGKGGVKLHELYDVKTDIPTFSVITDASVHDSQVMELIPYEKESFYIFDRAYMATEKLYIIEEAEAYFVVREKHKMSFEVIEDKEYNNPSSGIMADQIIRFKGHKTKKQYPKELRRVVFYDYDGNRTFVFYTNNFDVTAEQVALLYKYRWRVELFFKWLKQHLRIKEFYGTSENAVKIQIYAAIIAYCLVVIVQECMGLKLQTYDVLRILSTALLTKMPLCDLLVEQKEEESTEGKYQQLCLNFDG